MGGTNCDYPVRLPLLNFEKSWPRPETSGHSNRECKVGWAAA